MSSTRRIVRIAKQYNKKAHVLHISTKQEIDFLSHEIKNLFLVLLIYEVRELFCYTALQFLQFFLLMTWHILHSSKLDENEHLHF